MREIIKLNQNWVFAKAPEAIPQTLPTDWEQVNVPHCWNAVDGQDGGNDYFRGTCHYAKVLRKSELPQAAHYFLEIRGANSSADVYLDGKHLAHHDGGYSTWRVELNLAEESLLVIAVDNAANETVYPQMADFTFYGGLYRDVNLICVSESHFDLEYYGGTGLMITPEINGADALVKIDTFVSNSKPNHAIRYTIYDAQEAVIAQSEVAGTHAELTIANVHLWHGRKDPYLYCCEVELLEDGVVIDNVCSRFGCRTFKIDPDNGFILNGEEYPLTSFLSNTQWTTQEFL